MKLAKADIYSQASSIPTLKFEEQQLTSFAGLVVFQKLFESCRLKARLQEACAHLPSRHYYSFSTILQCLIVHIVLGYRQLRESEFYREDPLVKRVLGLRWLPSVPTVSRMLSEFDDKSVVAQQALSRGLVLERLEKEALHTVTLDFDGSVQSTKRHAEGTAVGFNKEKKGARSYYPLFCTVAQTGQVLDVLHRSGNVHDSKGSVEFVTTCVMTVRERHRRDWRYAWTALFSATRWCSVWRNLVWNTPSRCLLSALLCSRNGLKIASCGGRCREWEAGPLLREALEAAELG